MLDNAPVLGDPRLIERLAANLLDNAIRHNIDKGQVTVTTATVSGRAVLHVSNTGPGVPAAEIRRLLEPFHRLRPDRGAHGHGLGIGVSIVQAVTAAHQAQLTVAPRPDGVLRVEVSLAATSAASASPMPAVAPSNSFA